MNQRALVRRPAPASPTGCSPTSTGRRSTLDLAQRQWEGYVAALRAEGWETVEVPPADDCPDAVFVEDTVVVYGDLAVHRPARAPTSASPRPPAPSRRCAGLGYRIARIEEPGTLDGGDVLKHGGTVWVGLGGRTNQSGRRPARRAARRRSAPRSSAYPSARCCT